MSACEQDIARALGECCHFRKMVRAFSGWRAVIGLVSVKMLAVVVRQPNAVTEPVARTAPRINVIRNGVPAFGISELHDTRQIFGEELADAGHVDEEMDETVFQVFAERRQAFG